MTHRRAPWTTRATTALATLCLAATLAGCGGDNKADDKPAADGPGPAMAGPVISPKNLPQPPAVKNPHGAVADTTVGDCATGAGTHKVEGKVTNSAKKAADFVVTVNWTNATSDVLGRGFVVVRHVAPGATTSWSLTGKVVDGATTCVPNVLRGTVKK